MNIIDTKSVGKIILNENTPEREHRFEHYLIPYYQRGYRWDIENVEALLDDIHNFIKSREENYCLQPIVVVPNVDENGHNIWEVIDGQQRLITMYIIFQYLNKPRYSIFFGQRAKSTSFLKDLNDNTFNHDNPDFHFMSQAYEIVKGWFEKKTRNDVGYIDDFYSSITKKVQVIWYQIEELISFEDEEGHNEIESKKIDIFNRLNIGKIPLTDAELIRALLLSKIKHGLSERESIMRQSEISNEWHQIETDLRTDEIWYFLNNKTKENTSSAIELIFKLIAENNSKKYSTYLWFEKQIRGENEDEEQRRAYQLWNQTKEYYYKIKYWYNKNELFHYIGYLLAINTNNEATLRHIFKNANCAKSTFIDWAEDEVRLSLKGIDLNQLSYEKNKQELHKIFLLHNVLTVKNLNSSQKIKFPFYLYKQVNADSGWSIEHIHAQQSQQMKEEKAIRNWLKETYKAIENISTVEREYILTDDNGAVSSNIEIIDLDKNLKNQIKQFIDSEKINVDEFNILKNELIRIFESNSIHELDNLALLSKKDNSSLNNSIFPVKRNKIIQLEKEGKFIPPTTRNVFLKFYSNSDQQPFYWSNADKKGYFSSIKEVVEPFLS
ncbi:DUF262 domain-containing protein [Flavobacterium sp.]|jgi:uncharacterized protein with ParB-like and HNH nuclease domain|uniref:DUF262 domain-containing protein n=1 Tax=Flavobacterium sp. TaxID=239 RepID=UPI0037BFA92C